LNTLETEFRECSIKC